MRYSLALLAAAVAVQASPVAFPQGVTSEIAPTASAPSGCMPTYTGTFGIAVANLTASASATAGAKSDGQPTVGSAAPVTTISDGQPQAASSAIPVTTISDGQPQAATAVPVTQISDGQIQATTKTMMGVSQIGDGQIQAMYTAPAVSQISDGQIQATTAGGAVSQISDGQIQASTATAAVSEISDGQPQAASATGAAVTQISDGQPQASGTAATQATDGQPAQATGSSSGMTMVACQTNSTLELTLAGGVLTDNKGRTGYIAANYQFQFDDPPQAGSIYTAGWSICSNGSLALGGSSIFYQCLSGSFYNLYNVDWAAQCNPVTISAVELVKCSA